MAQDWEQKLCFFINNQCLDLMSIILTRPDVVRDGNLSRSEWSHHQMSPWHAAVRQKSPDQLNLMVKLGRVDVNSWLLDERGCRSTALAVAVMGQKEEMVRALLELGADLTLESQMGKEVMQPLEWAKRMTGFERIVRMLEHHRDNSPCQQTLKAFLSKEAKERELKEAMEIQEKVNANTKEIDKVDEQLEQLGSKEIKFFDQALESQELQNDIIMEEIDSTEDDIEKLDARKKELNAELIALKQEPGFRTDEQIHQLSIHLSHIEKMATSLREVLSPSKQKRVQTCPVCHVAPDQVLACVQCHKWLCKRCKEQLEFCPNCQVDFKVRLPQRNVTVERILRDL